MSAIRAFDAHDLSSPVPTLRSRVATRNEAARLSQLRTILVASDLTETSRPWVQRAAQIVQKNSGRLVVCHPSPKVWSVDPLFPQRFGEAMAATAENEHRVVETLTERVASWTGLSSFDVVIDFGDPAAVLCAQAVRHGADLVVVGGESEEDEEDEDNDALTTGLAASGCSLLVLRPSEGRAAALFALQTEIDLIPDLAHAATDVSPAGITKFVVILWADSEEAKAPLLEKLDAFRATCGAPLEPWFADLADSSVLQRVASDAEIGLVAVAAPHPDPVVERRATPLDDALENATASFLLLRR